MLFDQLPDTESFLWYLNLFRYVEDHAFANEPVQPLKYDPIEDVLFLSWGFTCIVSTNNVRWIRILPVYLHNLSKVGVDQYSRTLGEAKLDLKQHVVEFFWHRGIFMNIFNMMRLVHIVENIDEVRN